VRIRYMERQLAVGGGLKADRVRRKAVYLVDKLLDEDDRRDQHPYSACQDRLHARGRKLVLAKKLE
jgi:hypothetical protein